MSVSRRQLLSLIGVGMAGAILSACAPGRAATTVEAPAEEAPRPESPPEGEVEEAAPVAPEEPTEEVEAAPEPSEAPPPISQTTIAIDFQGYGRTGDGASGAALEKLLAEYAELHPHVTIDPLPAGSVARDDIQGWTEACLVALDGPDLLFANWPDLIEGWTTAGLLGSWDDYLSAPNTYVPVNPRWRDQFVLPCAQQSNGRTAWIGLDAAALGTFYNKDLFAEMGLEPPTTWPEQSEALATIREHNKIPCAMYYGLDYAAWTFDAVANQAMYELFEEMAGGEPRSPTPVSVAQAVVDGWYGITSEEYQDTLRIATEWWGHAPEGYAEWGEDIGSVLFSFGEAATRLALVTENRQLHTDALRSHSPFEWGVWPIPVIPQELAASASGKPPMAVFREGFLQYIIPGYTAGETLDQAADFLMFLSVPENLGALVAEYAGLIGNIENTPLPAGLESLAIPDDAAFWRVDSLRSTHINAEMRDLWLEDWRSVLLGEMTVDEYTSTMQLLLEEAARAELT